MEKPEKLIALALSKCLPEISQELRFIGEQLNRQNTLLAKLCETPKNTSTIRVHCITPGGIKRSIVMDAKALVEDWHGNCNIVPENDAVVTSAVMLGKELVGETLPKDSDFECLMNYLIDKKF